LPCEAEVLGRDVVFEEVWADGGADGGVGDAGADYVEDDVVFWGGIVVWYGGEWERGVGVLGCEKGDWVEYGFLRFLCAWAM
jgi:hypothetical protein